MIYTLKDGREFDLQKAVEVSAIRDEGMDKQTISLSKISFTIRLKNGQSIKVERAYHYSDWGNAKKDLEQEREDILSAMDNLD